MPDARTALPFPFSLINAGGEALLACKLPLFPLRVGYLQEKARQTTGLQDFGNDYYLEGLQRLLRSVNEEVELNFFGRLTIHREIIRCLINRLLYTDFLKRYPEIREYVLSPPLIITGLPRTGTTYLHRMLGQDPHFSYLPFWEVNYPLPFPKRDKKDVSWREKRIAKNIRMRSGLLPDLDRKHLLRAHSPEEDLWLLGLTFQSPEFWVLLPVYNYFHWLLQCDWTKAFSEYLDVLKILQLRRKGKTLLLKAPMHLSHMGAFREAVPLVQFIHTWRDPVKVVNSVNSLIWSIHEKLAKNLDRERLARTHIHYLQGGLNKAAQTKAQYPDIALDVQYEDLVRFPKESVRSIYRHFDFPWSRSFEKKLDAYILKHPKNKYGKHVYDSASFGLTDDFITAQFNQSGIKI